VPLAAARRGKRDRCCAPLAAVKPIGSELAERNPHLEEKTQNEPPSRRHIRRLPSDSEILRPGKTTRFAERSLRRAQWLSPTRAVARRAPRHRTSLKRWDRFPAPPQHSARTPAPEADLRADTHPHTQALFVKTRRETKNVDQHTHATHSFPRNGQCHARGKARLPQKKLDCKEVLK